MKNRLKELYVEGRLTVIGVAAAVNRGWITVEDYEDITGLVYGGE